ncbi:MAG TPA: DUF2971 domain-containing protein, partial [Pirellula sp.]|nr:DUF2971 domain-containing protein [Pirellula sp.]
LLFKYVGKKAAEAALKTQGQFSLRFNLPKNYNDPYELFLNTDKPLETREEIAFYECFLRELPDEAVTCFSKRPESVVMWAHYCGEGTGICLAIDENDLVNQFEQAFIDDVEYTAVPAMVSAYDVKYACTTKKNRHTEQLMRMAMRAAYFRKRADWSYEHERRLVVSKELVPEIDGRMIATFPASCLRFIILGPKAESSLVEHVVDWAGRSGISVLQMCYSRKRYQPFFTSNDKSFEWRDGAFVSPLFRCAECMEPIEQDTRVCEWCQISDEDKHLALISSQFALFRMYGLATGVPLPFDTLEPKGRHYRKEDEA